MSDPVESDGSAPHDGWPSVASRMYFGLSVVSVFR